MYATATAERRADQAAATSERIRRPGLTTYRLRRAAQTVAEVRGWTGRTGGWIYDERGNRIVQGWDALGRALIRAGYLTREGRANWRAMDLARNPAGTVRAYSR